jgi:hypothetical protein
MHTACELSCTKRNLIQNQVGTFLLKFSTCPSGCRPVCSVYHKHFINADTCCNPEPVVFSERSSVSKSQRRTLRLGVLIHLGAFVCMFGGLLTYVDQHIAV